MTTPKKGGEKPSNKGPRTVARDAVSGRFVTSKEAQRRPRTTVVETVKAKPASRGLRKTK